MDGFPRYHEAVDYLQRRLWHDLPIVPVERALQRRVRQVLAHLGDPHLAMPVVQVGGSAGKGSTTAMTAAILRASGHRTGMYTSPHLQTFIERIDVDGALIAPGEFADTVLGLDPLVRQMHLEVIDGIGYGRPALVEVAFATGMRHFASEQCDAAVIEVGLGGRTDCTNVFDTKPVTVITNIEREHTDRLGTTYTSIAREKAALIRGREVVVTAARHREALGVIAARCQATGATLWRLGREVRLRVASADHCGSVIDVRTPAGAIIGARVPLAGPHQASNGALAIAAALAFGAQTGRRVDADAVREGIARTRISGRMEVMQQSPAVVLDSAHNPIEAAYLARTLREGWLARDGKLHLVCGILADKDQAAMVRALAPVGATAVVTTPPLAERAGDPERMVALFRRELGDKAVSFESSPGAALDRALSHAASDDVVCVTGSMYVVGAVRERWVPEERILARRTAALGES